MVAYYFPPAGGAGVQRTMKFVRYLPDFGWTPHVVVPRDADYPVTDPSLVDEIPTTCTVHPSRIIEPYEVYRKITGRGGGSLDIATLSRSDAESRRPAERFSEWVRRNFFIPDARAGWIPFAARVGRDVATKTNAKILYSTAPPYSAHVAARRIHRATGIPWVADFRDSWVDWLSTPRRHGLARRIDLRLERSVLADASAVITVSEGVADDLASRHPETRDARWHVIPNGFDPNDLTSATPDRLGAPDDAFVLTYAGTLYGPRDPATLVDALDVLAGEGHPLASAIRLHLVGRVADNIRARIEKSRVARAVTFVDYVPHDRSIGIAKASDALLLIVDDVPQSAGILTGKLFEYLGLRKPILALAPEGEATAIVREARGWSVSPRDTTGMVDALREMWRLREAGTLEGPEEASVTRFTRRAQTERLAGLFDGLVR